MPKLEYNDYWFNYCFDTDPQEIKNHIREQYISSQNLKIHLDVYDNDQSSFDGTIIFLHGTSVYSRFYAEFLFNFFKRGYRIIAPDMIGHGLSEGIRGHFTMNQFSKTVYDVNSYALEKYGDKNILMGSSLGGINTLYSIAFDNRFKGAICHNAAIFNEKAYKKIIKMNLFLKLILPLVPIGAKIMPKGKLNTTIYLDFKKLAKTKRVLDRMDTLMKDPLLTLKYTLTSLRTQMKDPMVKPIEKVSTPIMFINGDEDILFSANYMEELYQRLTCKTKQLKIIKRASHLIFQENIPEVLKAIVPWLQVVLN
ncbi:MAG: alpha/beta fold hydrolase [Candidatus Odinarchaeota archaeon]